MGLKRCPSVSADKDPVLPPPPAKPSRNGFKTRTKEQLFGRCAIAGTRGGAVAVGMWGHAGVGSLELGSPLTPHCSKTSQGGGDAPKTGDAPRTSQGRGDAPKMGDAPKTSQGRGDAFPACPSWSVLPKPPWPFLGPHSLGPALEASSVELCPPHLWFSPRTPILSPLPSRHLEPPGNWEAAKMKQVFPFPPG